MVTHLVLEVIMSHLNLEGLLLGDDIEYVRVHLSYYEHAQVYISIVCLIMRINEKYNEFPFFYL